MGLQHVTSGLSDLRTGRARRRRLSPGGMRGPGESLRRCGALSAAGVLTSAARPSGRGELHTSRSASGGSSWIDYGWVTDMSVRASKRDEYDVLIVGGHHARLARFSGILPQLGRPTVAGPFDPTSAIAGGTRDQAAPVVDGVDREQQQRQVPAVRDASAAGRPTAIGSRRPVTAPGTSDPSDRSPRSDVRPLDIDAGLLHRAGLDARCRAPPPTIVYPAWAQGSADIARRHSAPPPQRLPPGGDHGEHRPTLTQTYMGGNDVHHPFRPVPGSPSER